MRHEHFRSYLLATALTTATLTGLLLAAPGQTAAAPVKDAQGNDWAITSQGTVTENGKPAAFTAQVVHLVNVGGVIYQQNSSGGWWAWNGIGWSGVSGDPTKGAVTAATIAGRTGANFSLSSSGTVLLNGSAAGNAPTAIKIVDLDGGVYARDSSGKWLAWRGDVWQKLTRKAILTRLAGRSCGQAISNCFTTTTTTTGSAITLTETSTGSTGGSATGSTTADSTGSIGSTGGSTAGDATGSTSTTGSSSGSSSHSGACAGSVPAPAAAAGYNTLTFSPHVVPGQNWFLDKENGTTANAKVNADGSVTIAGGGDTWNGQLATAYSSGTGYTGEVFGGGFYVEATISVPGPTYNLTPWYGGKNGNQWPSFWANNSVATGKGNGTIETDFMEMMEPAPGAYDGTIHNWTTKPQTWYGESLHAPAGSTLNGANKYGFLWVPATATAQGSMTFYLNGQPVGSPITWTKGKPGMYGIIDGQQMGLYLGAGANSPAIVSCVEVWQASSAGNSINGAPAPAANFK